MVRTLEVSGFYFVKMSDFDRKDFQGASANAFNEKESVLKGSLKTREHLLENLTMMQNRFRDGGVYIRPIVLCLIEMYVVEFIMKENELGLYSK